MDTLYLLILACSVLFLVIEKIDDNYIVETLEQAKSVKNYQSLQVQARPLVHIFKSKMLK